jgi:CubicO group peptidase (beta-lactamase class C family)
MADAIWAVLDAHVAGGRVPGYAAAVRVRGESFVRAAGEVGEDTLFRIASVTKPIGAVLTLSLIEEGVLALDDPVARWLPEAAAPRVLVAPDAELDETVEAVRPITVRQLLTMTCGWGAVLSDTPLRRAMLAAGVYSGALGHDMTADAFVAGVCALPLAFQPGEGWLYDTPMNLLGILLMRATGRSLSSLLEERVFGPLDMTDTAFCGPAERLATAYKRSGDGLAVLDPPDGVFSRPPAFEELNGGLVSTVGDVFRFFCAMADGELLTAESRALMVTDALTPEQRTQAFPIIEAGGSWGLGTGLYPGGAWGWEGGTGTTAHVDPVHDAVGVLLTQRMMQEPRDAYPEFWEAVAHEALR